MARRSSGVTPTVTNSMIRSPGPSDSQRAVPRAGQLHRELDDACAARREARAPTRARAPPRAARPCGLGPPCRIRAETTIGRPAGQARGLRLRHGAAQRPKHRAGGCRAADDDRPLAAQERRGVAGLDQRHQRQAEVAVQERQLPPGRSAEQVVAAEPGIQDHGVRARRERARAAPGADARVVGPGRARAEEHLVPRCLQGTPQILSRFVVALDEQDAKRSRGRDARRFHGHSSLEPGGGPQPGLRVPFIEDRSVRAETPSGGRAPHSAVSVVPGFMRSRARGRARRPPSGSGTSKTRAANT